MVVNKDVFDYWRSQHSEEDLFMNLVTSALYIPGYFQEEMELHPDFQITVSEEVGRFFSFSPYAVKKYFQKCAYYESYANPRLLFQHLSRKITDNQIIINGNDAEYLYNKVRLYQFNELIYDYFYRHKEINFRHLLAAVKEFSTITSQIKSKNHKGRYKSEIVKFFQEYFIAIARFGSKKEIQEFWKNADDDEVFLYTQLEAFINIIKENDQIDHFPATNYIIRRLTDFTKIIIERHLISVAEIVDNMDFETYEYNDIIGQYLIHLLIPMNIIILNNSKVIEIKKNIIYYK
mgnify:CR=1 FL=1